MLRTSVQQPKVPFNSHRNVQCIFQTLASAAFELTTRCWGRQGSMCCDLKLLTTAAAALAHSMARQDTTAATDI
jgi:hypothetical protein